MGLNKTILFISLLLLVTSAYASTPRDTFELASKALQQQNYYDAIQLYESIHESGYHSTPLYYNLGSAYLNIDKTGYARFYFEKAIYEDPLNENILANIDHIRNKIADYYPFPKYPFFPTIENIHSKIGHRAISLSLWVFYMILLASWYIFWVRKMPVFKWIGVMCLVFLIASAGLFISEWTYKGFHEKMCILFEEEVSLYEKPDVQSNVISTLSAGHKFKLEEKLGEFSKVSLGDGSLGWIKTKQFQYIHEKSKADV